MSAAGIAARGRAAAERIMTDTCTITRPAATGTLNPTTGQVVKTATTIYTGKCRVKAEAGTSVGDVGAGETAAARVTPIVSIPLSAATVHSGDRVLVSASSDDELDGKALLVRAVAVGTFLTARRLICEVL